MKILNSLDKRICHYEKGSVSLLVGMTLLISSTIMSFTVAQTGLMETRMANNEYRALEVENAAEGGVEFGVAWLSTNLASWENTEAGLQEGLPGIPSPIIQAANGDTYNLDVSFIRNPGFQYFVQVTSVATSTSDGNISSVSSQYVAQDTGPLNPGLDAAPLVINGCISNVNGTPDIYPSGYNGGNGIGPFGSAIETSEEEDGGDCIDLGNMNIHSGDVGYEHFSGSAWDYIFRKTRGEIQTLADAEVAAGVPDSERNYVWVTSNANYNDSWGSVDNPVVLVFAPSADCPAVNGNPTIYGIVFVDSDCGSANGWGGAEIYGSLVIDGDLEKVTANAEFYDFTEATGNTDVQFPPDKAPKILGTWSDF